MGDLVGIVKELREGEKVSFDIQASVPIVLFKEVDTKGLIRRGQREVPTALMYANLYVTNERLLFLVFYQVQEEDSRKGDAEVRLSDISATWFAIPIESIQEIEAHNLDPSKSKDVRQFLEKSGESGIVDRVGVELVYGGRDLTGEDKEFSQSLLRMGALKRLTTKAESISDKLFIATDQASLLASNVQGAMGIKASLESGPPMTTQQFTLSEPAPQHAPAAEEDVAVEAEQDLPANSAPEDDQYERASDEPAASSDRT